MRYGRMPPNNQGFTVVQSSNLLNNPYDKFQKYFGNTEHHQFTAPGEHNYHDSIHSRLKPMLLPELLFVGAAICRQKPNWGTVDISFENGDLNLDCLSQLKICMYWTDCAQYTDANDRGHHECKYMEDDCRTEAGYGLDKNRYHMACQIWRPRPADGFFPEPGYMGPFMAGELDYRLRSKDAGTEECSWRWHWHWRCTLDTLAWHLGYPNQSIRSARHKNVATSATGASTGASTGWADQSPPLPSPKRRSRVAQAAFSIHRPH